MPLPFDAVFFDLGGTLFSYLPFRRPLGALIESAGQRLGATRNARELKHTYNLAAGRAAENLVGRAYYLHRDLFCETYREFARELTGREAPDEFVEWFYTAQRELMIEHMQLRDDCEATLHALRSRGLSLEIVSNIDDDFLDPMIDRSGLAQLVDAWTSSETAQSCKPDAGFFRHCLERSGHLAERVLFVGDSPVHDIAGARAQDMTTVLIEEVGAPPPAQEGGAAAEPHHRIQSLSELLPLTSGI